MPASAHSVARKRGRMRASAPTIHGPVNRYEKKQKEKALKPGKFRDVPDRTQAGCLRSQGWLVPGPPQAQSVLFLFFTCLGRAGMPAELFSSPALCECGPSHRNGCSTSRLRRSKTADRGFPASGSPDGPCKPHWTWKGAPPPEAGPLPG